MRLDSNLMQPSSRLAYGWKDDTGVDPIRVSRPRLPHNYLAMSALDGLRCLQCATRHKSRLGQVMAHPFSNSKMVDGVAFIAASCLNSSLRTVLQKPPNR